MDYSNNTHYKHSLNKQNQSNPLILIKKQRKHYKDFAHLLNHPLKKIYL